MGRSAILIVHLLNSHSSLTSFSKLNIPLQSPLAWKTPSDIPFLTIQEKRKSSLMPLSLCISEYMNSPCRGRGNTWPGSHSSSNICRAVNFTFAGLLWSLFCWITLLSIGGDNLPKTPALQEYGLLYSDCFYGGLERRAPKLKPHFPAWARACCMSPVYSLSLSSADCFPARAQNRSAYSSRESAIMETVLE